MDLFQCLGKNLFLSDCFSSNYEMTCNQQVRGSSGLAPGPAPWATRMLWASLALALRAHFALPNRQSCRFVSCRHHFSISKWTRKWTKTLGTKSLQASGFIVVTHFAPWENFSPDLGVEKYEFEAAQIMWTSLFVEMFGGVFWAMISIIVIFPIHAANFGTLSSQPLGGWLSGITRPTGKERLCFLYSTRAIAAGSCGKTRSAVSLNRVKRFCWH